MIYIHRDWNTVPQNIKDDLIEAALALDAITDKEERKRYIQDNSNKWSAVREYLLGMSFGKCWYTEAKESVSRYQVDHFRPHGRAKQEPKVFAEGYSWLAFDIYNFRLAGQLCNTANQEYSQETVGKSDWFPLLNPLRRASIDARDISIESPLLLDPTDPDDPAKLLFNDAGEVDAALGLDEDIKSEVRLATKYLGLTQSQLNNNRRKTWRNCTRSISKFNIIAKKPKGSRTQEEKNILNELRDELLGMSKSSSEFSAVVRCCLIANGLSQLIIRDEMHPLQTVET